jgi:hypothetical protein
MPNHALWAQEAEDRIDAFEWGEMAAIPVVVFSIIASLFSRRVRAAHRGIL